MARKRSKRRDLFAHIVLWPSLLLSIALLSGWLKIFTVRGPSMMPTIHDGDIIVAVHREPRRSDIVVVKHGEQWLCKRVVGLPGDTLQMTDIIVTVNKHKEEGYGIIPYPSYINEFQLADDEYYILGDNRAESLDSLAFGAVSRDEIKYRTLLVVPIGRLGIKDRGEP